MDERTIRSQSGHMRDDALKMVAPLQKAWKNLCFDLPLAMFSETMRFAGQRLQAQGEFLASLKTCRTIPDMVDAQSTFVRTAARDYEAETGNATRDVRSVVTRAN